jgi:hypothetical protein
MSRLYCRNSREDRKAKCGFCFAYAACGGALPLLASDYRRLTRL